MAPLLQLYCRNIVHILHLYVTQNPNINKNAINVQYFCINVQYCIFIASVATAIAHQLWYRIKYLRLDELFQISW